MITDNFLRVSSAQAVSQATGTSVVSTTSIDLGLARDVGEGEDIYAVFSVNVAGTGAAAYLAFEVIASDTDGLSTNVVRLGASDPYLATSLTAGTMVAVRINPRIASKGSRYLGARYVVSGTGTATATVTADIVNDIQDGKKFYASGFTVV